MLDSAQNSQRWRTRLCSGLSSSLGLNWKNVAVHWRSRLHPSSSRRGRAGAALSSQPVCVPLGRMRGLAGSSQSAGKHP